MNKLNFNKYEVNSKFFKARGYSFFLQIILICTISFCGYGSSTLTEDYFKEQTKKAMQSDYAAVIFYFENINAFKIKFPLVRITLRPLSIFKRMESDLRINNHDTIEIQIKKSMLAAYLNFTYDTYLRSSKYFVDEGSISLQRKMANTLLTFISDQAPLMPESFNNTVNHWYENVLFQVNPALLYSRYFIKELEEKAFLNSEDALTYLHVTRFMPKNIDNIVYTRGEIFKKYISSEITYFQAALRAYYGGNSGTLLQKYKNFLESNTDQLNDIWYFFSKVHFIEPASQSKLNFLSNMLRNYIDYSSYTYAKSHEVLTLYNNISHKTVKKEDQLKIIMLLMCDLYKNKFLLGEQYPVIYQKFLCLINEDHRLIYYITSELEKIIFKKKDNKLDLLISNLNKMMSLSSFLNKNQAYYVSNFIISYFYTELLTEYLKHENYQAVEQMKLFYTGFGEKIPLYFSKKAVKTIIHLARLTNYRRPFSSTPHARTFINNSDFNTWQQLTLSYYEKENL